MLLMLAPAASADTVLAPVDGATVSSTPTFQFDFTNGVAEVELSRQPDLKTAGTEAGAFVDRDASEYFVLYDRNPQDGIGQWRAWNRLDSGLYYWHVKTRNDDTGEYGIGEEGPWQQTMTLTVRDEAPIFEGWTIRATRLKASKRCQRRIRITGKIVVDDNDPQPAIRYRITLMRGPEKVGRAVGRLGYEDYSAVGCVRRWPTLAGVQVRDRVGQVSPGETKRL